MSSTRSFPQNAASGSTLHTKACVCLKEAHPHSHKSFELQSHFFFFQSSSLGVEIALKILRTAVNHPSGCASAIIYFLLTEPLLPSISVCIILWLRQRQKLGESQRGRASGSLQQPSGWLPLKFDVSFIKFVSRYYQSCRTCLWKWDTMAGCECKALSGKARRKRLCSIKN